jgi:SAM-dependent methyltransferase
MPFVKIDPPGTFCTNEAMRDLVREIKPSSFIEVGCGDGMRSKLLCAMGMTGVGMDFSDKAIETSAKALESEIAAGRFRLVQDDFMQRKMPMSQSEMALSCMVMEHIHDDVGFVARLRDLVAPGGVVAVFVPGRKDHWSFEDATVGHLRRYEREELKRTLEAGGIKDVQVWSVAVPTVNLLFNLSNWLIQHSAEAAKIGQSQRAQTETSGLRDIPWKTVFPGWVKLILNRFTLYPLFVVQRLFYRSGFGLILFGFGWVR